MYSRTGMDFAKVSLAILYLISYIPGRFAEIFTSTYQLSTLLDLDIVLNQALEKYIQDETTRLENLKTYLRLKRQKSRVAFHGLSGNPVNYFTSSRKFLKGLKDVETVVKRKQHKQEFLSSLTEYEKTNISHSDLEGAREAILRLQIVYDITPRDFTNGDIGKSSGNYADNSKKIDRHSLHHTSIRNSINQKQINNQSDDTRLTVDKSSFGRNFSDDTNISIYGSTSSSVKLSVIDNYDIGREAYSTGRRKQALQWMENVLYMMGTEKSVTDFTKEVKRTDVLDHLAYLEYQFANLNKSFSYYQEMLRIDPSNSDFRENFAMISSIMVKNETSTPATDDDEGYDHDMRTYMKQCRDANDVNTLPSNDRRLSCRYENKHPQFRLRPVAVETLGVDPYIELFHGVLRDGEIETLLEIAKPKLLRARINNGRTGQVEAADYRISKNAWIEDYESKVIETINRRMTALTGLTTDTAEILQINNYGIGGQYEPHYDHSLNLSTFPLADTDSGNRIATLMFYLSDVEAGGSTVFIDTGVNSKPVKGNAVFWYNLKRSGKGDTRTIHAGCPVLIGNKWVANKWFHEFGNEFRRPCGLNEND